MTHSVENLPDGERYEGRPLLRLLDCCVLAVIGQLDPEAETRAASAVKVYLGGGPDWTGTLRRSIKLPDDMDSKIQRLWSEQPAGTDPYAFMLAVSNGSFLPMIDPDQCC